MIIIFSGTTEGRSLSSMLSEKGIYHTVSVASEYGLSMMEKSDFAFVSVGKLDADGMADLIRGRIKNTGDNEDCIIIADATHPYAKEATENIKKAASILNAKYIRIKREDSMQENDKRIKYFETTEEIKNEIKNKGGNILLTTGSKELAAFTDGLSEELISRVFVRVLPTEESIRLCEDAKIKKQNIIAMHGPFGKDLNRVLIKQFDIKHLVTKDGGTAGGFEEKISAAKDENIDVYVISRPEEEAGGVSVEEAFGEILKTEGAIKEEQAEKADKKITQISTETTTSKEKNSDTYEDPTTIILAGIGPGKKDYLTENVRTEIKNADAVFGAKRMVEGIEGRVYEMYLPEDIIPVIKKENIKRAVILFSGDTGFYSGARKMRDGIKEALPDAKVKVVSGISSMSYFASRIGISYDDAKLFSIHGKSGEEDIKKLYNMILENRKVISLLSGGEDIRRLAKKLAGKDHSIHFIVGNNLSYEDETIDEMTPEEALDIRDLELPILLSINDKPEKRKLTGALSDESFIREGIPMTKECIRHECIRRLDLKEGDTVIDVGGGTGSVAIEIALLSDTLNVKTIEIKHEACELIKKNKEKHDAANLEIIEGDATDVLKEMKLPDAVFIGGSCGKLEEIVNILIEMKGKMNVCINSVTEKTTQTVERMITEKGFRDAKCVELSVTDTYYNGNEKSERVNNPVKIFSFKLGEEDE